MPGCGFERHMLVLTTFRYLFDMTFTIHMALQKKPKSDFQDSCDIWCQISYESFWILFLLNCISLGNVFVTDIFWSLQFLKHFVLMVRVKVSKSQWKLNQNLLLVDSCPQNSTTEVMLWNTVDSGNSKLGFVTNFVY